jgi:hypothetical protein
MNLQENIRRILKEETNLPALIRRRISFDRIEKEFKESLEGAFDMFIRAVKSRKEVFTYQKGLESVIRLTITMLMDSIHYELYSTLPEDIQWYDDVYKILEKHYRSRIIKTYMKYFNI